MFAKAGATSRAISSSSRIMCACGMPGKKVRQIKWVIPYSSVKRRIWATHCSGPPMMKRSAMSRSRSVAIDASMKGWRHPPAYSFRYAIMMCSSASSRALLSVSATMTSRVSGHSAIGWLRPAARRLSRNRCLPASKRLRSAVGPGIQLSARVAARLRVMSPQPPLHRVIGAPEAHALLGPEPLHDRQLLLESRAALLELDAVEREFVGLVADRDAERDAPARHDVEHRDVLGEPHGMVERGDHDVGAEHHARGPGREPGEHRQGRGPVVIRDGVVLFHPHRVEPELFGPRDLFERLAVVLPALDGDEADLEPCHGARA